MKKWLGIIISAVMAVAVSYAVAFAANSATINVTVSIAQKASISVTGGPVDFGAMKIGGSSVSSSAVVVKNNGSGGNETYSLSLINPSGWTAVTAAPGVDQYRLSSAFDATGTVTWNPTNHALTTSSLPSTAAKFAGSETGTAVLYNADRHLYLKLETPSATLSSGSKTIQIVIMASVD
ncbi:MAG: hypothetical protein NT033_00155 [Candidatus Omnitrophica bacterium]|nr:hypothetical protein [Candidatus Omnitrophota bacterium]